MEKIDILLWIMGGGFALMLVMWKDLGNRMCDQNKKIDQVKDDLGKRIDEVNVKIAEVDKRLYGIETVLHMKECCVLKQDQQLKKVD
jgi:hypothetical protein